MQYFFVAVVIIFLSGCSVTTPPILEYRIAPTVSIKQSSSTGCHNKSLKVNHVFSSNTLMSSKMRYAQDDYQELAFNESRWSTSPNSAIYAALMKNIDLANIFANVKSFKSRSESDLVLETDVEEFIQYFKNNNTESFVRAVIVFSLVDVKTMKVLHEKRFYKELVVESIDAKGGVKALNSAFGDILAQNNRWLSELCQ